MPLSKSGAQPTAQLLEIAEEMETRKSVVGKVQLKAWASRIRSIVAQLGHRR
jgi:hypothetical protein